MNTSITNSKKFVTLKDVKHIGSRGKSIIHLMRDDMLAPEAKKSEPLFTFQTIAQSAGVHKTTVTKTLTKAAANGIDLPTGRVEIEKGKLIPYQQAQKLGLTLLGNERRYFTCEEASQIIKYINPTMSKPEGVRGAVIAVCNYKGGVAKTYSTICLAQALATRGMKVLCVDLDPQGSLTSLFGFLHVKDVRPEDTALNLFLGKTDSLAPCVRNTYWSNIDLIPATSELNGSEFAFRELLRNVGVDSVGRLQQAIQKLMGQYDVCLIDTPPSLNSLTNSSLFATDGVVMPIPASNLELASAVQFWDMYNDICSMFDGVSDDAQVFKFLKIIIPKMENTVSCKSIKNYIHQVYGEYVSEVTIPKSAAVSRASDSFGTVFDVLPDSNKKLLDAQLPVREAYKKIALELEDEIKQIWALNACEN